jgi:hypothetical protein
MVISEYLDVSRSGLRWKLRHRYLAGRPDTGGLKRAVLVDSDRPFAYFWESFEHGRIMARNNEPG